MPRRILVGVALVALAAGAIAAVVVIWGSDERSPRVGDHWHATYTFRVCGEKQPNAPFWQSGVHSEGDGLLHISPFTDEEEGGGARLVKWFEYGVGLLTDYEVRLPGQDRLYRNGNPCPDGSTGVVQVFVTTSATGVEEKLDDWSEYIPKDGDRIAIGFGPE